VPSLVPFTRIASGKARYSALSYVPTPLRAPGRRAGHDVRRGDPRPILFATGRLCGGLTSLVTGGFETLVEAGLTSRIPYFESSTSSS